MELRVLLLLSIVVFGMADCKRRSSEKLNVGVSNRIIKVVVEAIGGERVAVNLIAPDKSFFPFFEMPPITLIKASTADLILYQFWEEWMDGLESKIKNPNIKIVKLTTEGNWMVPTVHKEGAKEITKILVETDPVDSIFYYKNCERYLREIDSLVRYIKGLFSSKDLPKVIAAENQRDFLTWLGFPVVATYDPREIWTREELSRLAEVIVDSGVGLIVDDRDSRGDAGRDLAEAGKIKQVILENIPQEGSYFKSLMNNCHQIAKMID